MRGKKRSKHSVNGTGAATSLTLRFYGDEFIFDTVSGMFFRISPTASLILRSLQSGTRPDRLADEIQERYGISRSAALRDVELLRNDLAGIEALDRFAP
jgi:hypothetical protein